MGLVPVVPDAHTKPQRELFVGNTPQNTTERMLIDHLNAAMASTKMATGPGAPVLNCRVSANFAFVELRSIDETDRALSLTGLPYLGCVLKIGRPSKYEGPSTPATTWQQMLLDGDYATAMQKVRGFNARGESFYGGSVPMDSSSLGSGQPAPVDAVTADKIRRELFVGNTTSEMAEGAIRAFLGLVALQMRQVIGPGDPIISLRLSGHFAFVELRSIDETNAMLKFNGIPFMSTTLRIGRPSKYAAAGFRDDTDPDKLRWENTLDDFRHGRLPPLEARGDLVKPPLTENDVDQLAHVADGATRTIVLKDLIDDVRFPTEEHLSPENNLRRRDAIVNGVVNDLTTECNKFGLVNTITPLSNNKDLLVSFNLVSSTCLSLLSHRSNTPSTPSPPYPINPSTGTPAASPSPRIPSIRPPSLRRRRRRRQANHHPTSFLPFHFFDNLIKVQRRPASISTIISLGQRKLKQGPLQTLYITPSGVAGIYFFEEKTVRRRTPTLKKKEEALGGHSFQFHRSLGGHGGIDEGKHVGALDSDVIDGTDGVACGIADI